MTGNIEVVTEIFTNATAYLLLRRFDVPFSLAKKQLLQCRASVLKGITGAAPPPL
jgi:hypothetical protein